jgi:hypothetical protein
MSSRRFSLTLLAALGIAGSFVTPLPIKAQAVSQKPAATGQNKPTAKPTPQTTGDGPVALTERTNTRKPGEDTPKPLQKNQFGNFGAPLLNNKGDIAFVGRYVSEQSEGGYGSGVFLRKADGSWSYVRDGEKGVNLPAPILAMNQASLNENGDLLFTSTLNIKAPSFKVSGVEQDVSGNLKQSGILMKTAAGVKTVYLMGEEIPNNPATYIGFSAASINSKGTMAFIGTYTDPDGRGLFILENGKLSLVARSGQKTPADETSQYSEHFFPSAINERGEVAFFCRISGGGAIFVRRPTGIEAIALQDKPAPIPGSNYIGFGNRAPAINNKGEVVFVGFVDGEKAGRVLFFKGDGPTQVVVRSGDTVPDMVATFTDFNMPSVNSKGEVVFVANYAGRARGVFLKTAAGIETIALYERPVPGLDSKDERNSFNNFLNPVINDNGDIAFMAQLRNSSVGIFHKKKGEPLQMVAKSGDAVPFK